MFTTEHFIWIALCAVFVSGMCCLSVKKRFSLKRVGIIMTAICALSETNKVMTGMVDSPGGGIHLDPLCLPLHLCSLLIFAVLAFCIGLLVRKPFIGTNHFVSEKLEETELM